MMRRELSPASEDFEPASGIVKLEHKVSGVSAGSKRRGGQWQQVHVALVWPLGLPLTITPLESRTREMCKVSPSAQAQQRCRSPMAGPCSLCHAVLAQAQGRCVLTIYLEFIKTAFRFFSSNASRRLCPLSDIQRLAVTLSILSPWASTRTNLPSCRSFSLAPLPHRRSLPAERLQDQPQLTLPTLT
eukprot:763904-Hanusia_phi.AAC.3